MNFANSLKMQIHEVKAQKSHQAVKITTTSEVSKSTLTQKAT